MATKKLRTGQHGARKNAMEQSKELATQQKAYDFGCKIVDTESRHETSVRDLLIQCMSYSAMQIKNVALGLKDSYSAKLQSIYDNDGVADVSKLRSQVYARQSEKLAALECFTLMLTRPAQEQVELQKVINDATGYHNMISQCRVITGLINASVKDEPFTPEELTGARNKNKGFVKIETVITRINHTQDVTMLVQMRDACNARIAMLKPKQADVINLAQRKKARKAIADKADQAFQAVNKVRKSRKAVAA